MICLASYIQEEQEFADEDTYRWFYAIDTSLSDPVFFIGFTENKTPHNLETFTTYDKVFEKLKALEVYDLGVNYNTTYIPDEIQKQIIIHKMEAL
jgi:hypothetical protein